MRAAVWSTGLAVALLALAAVPLSAEAEGPHAPRERATIEEGTSRIQHFSGTSTLHLTGACLDATTCAGETRREDGGFFLPAMASDGRVEISWAAVNDSLAVLRVQVAGVVIEGKSPLHVDFPGLEGGQHLVRVAPARRVVGAYEQRVDWSASFEVSAPFQTLDTRGTSGYETLSGCVLGTCAPLTQRTSDTFVAPWPAQGGLLAEWDPRDGDMRLAIPGTQFVVEGPSPLAMPLDGIGAGEWSVELTPLGVLLPRSASVGWTVTLTQTP